MGYIETEYIRYKGKGKHSVNELEKIIEQREKELHLIKSGDLVKNDGVLGDFSGRFYSDTEIAILKEECYQDGIEEGEMNV